MSTLTLTQFNRKRIEAPRIPLALVDEENPFENLTIAGLMQKHRHLPDLTAILGVCEDGLPILLDFTDSKPGSVVVGSSQLYGAKQLIELAMISVLANSPAHEVEIFVVTREPEKWSSFKTFPGNPTIEIHPVYDRNSGAEIYRLCKILDERMAGRPREVVELLIVDDLNAMNFVDFDVQLNFKWLAKAGPEYRMWTIAGIEAENVQSCDHFLTSFQTRILGQIDDSFQAGWLANAPPPNVKAFHPTQQFTTRVNQNWMTFWLPGQD